MAMHNTQTNCKTSHTTLIKRLGMQSGRQMYVDRVQQHTRITMLHSTWSSQRVLQRIKAVRYADTQPASACAPKGWLCMCVCAVCVCVCVCEGVSVSVCLRVSVGVLSTHDSNSDCS